MVLGQEGQEGQGSELEEVLKTAPLHEQFREVKRSHCGEYDESLAIKTIN
jgi:hypothetical protein